MSFTILKKNPTQGEITSSLTGSTGDGAGLHFEGAAGAVSLGSSMPDLGTKYSLEFVVKGDARTGEVYLLDAYNSSSTNRVILAWSGNSNGNIQLHVNGTWSSAFIATPDNGEVVHLLLSVDGTSATLYQNGNSVSTQTVVANTLTSATNTHIGASQNGSGNFFNGTIFRTRFWNHALSSSEVQTAFERADVDYSSQYGSQTNLVSGYNFTSGYSAYGTGAVVDANTYTTGGAGSGIQKSLLTVGKKYRVTVAGSSSAGDFQIQAYGTWTVLATGFGTHEFTATTAAIALTATASSTVDVTSFSITAIGAVVDMDLGFANPSQSRTIQDRSTNNVDGTASASGVTQVQKVVQANVERLAVGGTPPRVGVGLGADVLPSNPLHIQSTDNQIALQGAAAGFGSQTAKISFSNSGQNSLDISTHYPSPSNANEISLSPAGSKSLVVKGGNGSATGPFMTIDASGKISCVNDITIQKNNGNLILHGTADGSQQAVLFRNDSDEDKGFIKYRDTYSSAGGNTMEVGTDGSTRLTIASTGNVSMGSTSSVYGRLFVDASTSGNEQNTALAVRGRGSGADYLALNVMNNADGALFSVRNDGLASFGGGIAFSQTNASGTGITSDASTLSHYEVGRWTPKYQASAGNDFNAISYGFQDGHYVRVGNICTVSAQTRTTNVDQTGMTTTADLLLGGLPFPAATLTGTSYGFGVLSIGTSYAGNTPTSIKLNEGASAFNLQYGNSNNHTQVGNMTVGSSVANFIGFQFTYQV